MFITFEGIDGCGKSTQLVLLGSRLEAAGCRVRLTREPGGTGLAEAVRGLLLQGAAMSSQAELLLFGAARAQHVTEIIRPALEAGEWVLSDRFGDSSRAYQGGGLGLDGEFIVGMNRFATAGLQPGVTFLLDLSPEDARHRLEAQGAPPDRIEKRGAEFYERVHAAYIEMAQAEPERFEVLDAGPPAKVIHERIVQALKKRGVWPGEAAEPERPQLRVLKGGSSGKQSRIQPPDQYRATPQSLEAEQAVLGAMMVDNGVIPEVLAVLKVEDFYREFNRRIFSVIRDLHEGGQTVDVLSVGAELAARGQREPTGGKPYLMALVEGYPEGTTTAYARIVQEMSEQRQELQRRDAE